MQQGYNCMDSRSAALRPSFPWYLPESASILTLVEWLSLRWPERRRVQERAAGLRLVQDALALRALLCARGSPEPGHARLWALAPRASLFGNPE